MTLMTKEKLRRELAIKNGRKNIIQVINYESKGCRKAKRPKTNWQEEFYWSRKREDDLLFIAVEEDMFLKILEQTLCL